MAGGTIADVLVTVLKLLLRVFDNSSASSEYDTAAAREAAGRIGLESRKDRDESSEYQFVSSELAQVAFPQCCIRLLVSSGCAVGELVVTVSRRRLLARRSRCPLPS